jgi:carbonic anhydrase
MEPGSVAESADAVAPTSRRRFLVGGTARVAGLALGLTERTWALPSPVHPSAPSTPDEALTQLMAGNGRYVTRRSTACQADLANRRQATALKQTPFAAVLSCADSRVPVELIFDQNIGGVFVTRVAGNVASTEIIASLEYGVAELGTPLIMVMGHASCGAVTAAIANAAVPGQISALFRYIRPAVDQAGNDLQAAVKANARIQARLLGESSPVLAEQLKEKSLRIVASYYDLTTGVVTLLDAT